jgi:hypothetical protein
MRTSQQQTFPISPSSLIATNFARPSERTPDFSTHQTQTTTAPTLSEMAQVSEDTKNQKIKSLAIISRLFPQFDDNQTIKSACVGRDTSIALDKLCTAIRQRYNNRKPEDQWSFIITLLNHALVRRIHTTNTSKSWVYGLKYEDFREAHKLRTMDSVTVSAMARDLDLVENTDGILMPRNPVSMCKRAKLVRLPDISSMVSSDSRQHSVDSDYDPVKQSRSPSASPVPHVASSERQLYKTFFDDVTLSDLTIKLGDRTVQVHRIVLCRVSEYFASLLKDNLQVCWNQQRLSSYAN